MISVSRVILDPRFSESFKVYRKSGEWIKGRFIQDEKELDMNGVITPAKPKQIEMIPEGDRVGGEICIHAINKLYTTHSDDESEGTSDEIEWHDERYKLYSVGDLSQFGYYSAIGIRLESC
ncbi:hypothetical protein FDE94_15115 [Clostridium botulinum]|nr:hypothetical protein [Clostridium botulinum]